MTAAADNLRHLSTPEGVDLRVRVAAASERAVALIIDLAIIVGALLAMMLVVVGFAIATRMQGAGGQVATLVWLLGFFVLRNFYFTAFECSPRAATPGKRIMKLRVAARSGEALRVEQLVARNACRELELYLPIGFLFAQGQEINAVIILCGVIWCAIFVFLPAFNRDRLRLGDIVAGTWVLNAPKQGLLPDIAATVTERAHAFTDAELDKYGITELQVLERVLRSGDPQSLETVASSIRRKLNRRKLPQETDLDFLNAYYAALRKRLEQRMLFGVRKRDKHDQV